MTDEERSEQAEERDDSEERDDTEAQEGDSTGEDSGDDASAESEDDTSAESGDDSADDSADDKDSGDDDSGDDSGRTVSDVMSSDPVTVEPSASVEEAAQKMKESDAGAVLVVDGGELKGIVTDRDITVDAVAEGEADAKVEDVMTSDPTTLSPDDGIDKAIEAMREQKVRRLPVVDDGKPVGVVSIGDLAAEADDSSVLGDIAGAEANN